MIEFAYWFGWLLIIIGAVWLGWIVHERGTRVESCLAENERLRRDLFEQWEVNHTEHCSEEWPHTRAGARCHWPPPASLGKTPAATDKLGEAIG